MTKATNKSATKPRKTRGRQSDFSGEKQAYLDSLAKDFLNRKDRSTFYDEAAQGLFDKFGYSRDGKVYVEADTLSAEEQLEYYQALRGVSVHFAINCIGVLTLVFVRNWDNGSDTDTWPSPQTGPMLRRSLTPLSLRRHHSQENAVPLACTWRKIKRNSPANLPFTGQLSKTTFPKKSGSQSIMNSFKRAGKKNLRAVVMKWRGTYKKNMITRFANGRKKLRHLTDLLRTSKGQIFFKEKVKKQTNI